MNEQNDSVEMNLDSHRAVDVLAAEFLLSLKIPPSDRVAAWHQLAAGAFVTSQNGGRLLGNNKGKDGFETCNLDNVFAIYEHESASKLERGCHDELAVRDGALIKYAQTLPYKDDSFLVAAGLDLRLNGRLGGRYITDSERARNGVDPAAVGKMPTVGRMDGVNWGLGKWFNDAVGTQCWRRILTAKDPGMELVSGPNGAGFAKFEADAVLDENVPILRAMNTREFYKLKNQTCGAATSADLRDWTSWETEMVNGKPKEFAVLSVPFDIGEAYRPKEFGNSPLKYVQQVLSDGQSYGYRMKMLERKVASRLADAGVSGPVLNAGFRGVTKIPPLPAVVNQGAVPKPPVQMSAGSGGMQYG